MRNMQFEVLNHPTKETPGRTIVSDEFVLEGGETKVVKMGELVKIRGVDGFDALSYTDPTGSTKALGHFKTRSQAGHAVRADYEADARAAKKVVKATSDVTSVASNALTIDEVAAQLGIDVSAAKKRAKRGTTVRAVDGGYEIVSK